MATITQITERTSKRGSEYTVFYESGRSVDKTTVTQTMKKFMKSANRETRMEISGVGSVYVYTPGQTKINLKSSIQNKVNRHDGARFEDLIKASCKMYADNGKAYIQKTPEPMRVLRNMNGGKFLAMFEKAAQPDFKGCLKGGTTIVFDTKHTSKDKILQSVVSDEQAKDLDAYSRMWASCYILVSLRFEHFYMIPWKTWKCMKEIFGHKHMTEEDLSDYEVPTKNETIHFLEYIQGEQGE